MYPCRAGAAFTSASMSMHTVVTQQATRSIVSLLLILLLFKTPHVPLGPRSTEAALALALE